MYTNHLPDSVVIAGLETLRFPIETETGLAVIGSTPQHLKDYDRMPVASCSWERIETADGIETKISVDLGKRAIQGFAYAQNSRRLLLPNTSRFQVSNGAAGCRLFIDNTPQYAGEFIGVDPSGKPQILAWGDLIHEAASKLLTEHATRYSLARS